MIILAILIFCVGAAYGYVFYLSKDRVDIPVSDHFDGSRFYNPIQQEKTSADIRKWRKESKKNRVVFPEWREIESFPPPPATFNENGKVRITFINHATTLIQLDGMNILTDPFYSERTSPVQWAGPRRIHAPGVAFDDLPQIDAVIISHNHYDHLDIPALKRLWYRDKPRIFVPLGDDVVIARNEDAIQATALDWGDSVELSPAVSLHFLRTQHWSARTPYDRNKSLWGAYALHSKSAGNIYFAGDTGYGDGSQFTDTRHAFGEFTVALLPIGAYDPRWFMAYAHINPDEAVRAMGDLNARRAIGIHFGMVQLTDEAVDDPLKQLQQAIRNHGIKSETFRALRPGESWIITKD